MPLALVIVQQVFLVAGLALLGQFVVAIFNWAGRNGNFVYRLLAVITRPAVGLVRRITPRVVVDEHVPAVTFLLLAVLYLAAGFWHRDVCLPDLMQAGCEKWARARGQ